MKHNNHIYSNNWVPWKSSNSTATTLQVANLLPWFKQEAYKKAKLIHDILLMQDVKDV
jgi:hypothetical protein